MRTPIMKNLQSAPAATSDARGIGNSNPSRVARPARAQFLQGARAARPAASELSTTTPGRAVRPGRALFLESYERQGSVTRSLALLLASAALLAAQQPAERTFPTPQEAAQALVDAVAHDDTAALMKLFGPQGADIVQSGDPVEDKSARGEFTRRAHEKMDVRIEPMNAGRAMVVTGNDNWPFPVPLIRAKDGQWHFDAARGRTEILARRIGRNELVAIDVCRGYVEAQMDYASKDYDKDGILEYAQKLVSTSGQKDGLYWDGEPGNLVPKAFADAADALAVPGKKVPYHGYYFRILKAQGPDAPGGAHSYVVKGEMIGGFALAAYPAEYGVSGIKTFIVNQDGVVYEKDLGPATDMTARQMPSFNPGKGWQAVQGE